jgi:hypothetical protein
MYYIRIYIYIYIDVCWECGRLIYGALCVGFRVQEHRKDALIAKCGGGKKSIQYGKTTGQEKKVKQRKKKKKKE